jgi:hypothetical protein
MDQNTQPVEEVQSQEVQQPVIVTFQMTLENVNALLGILGQQPYEQVAGFINAIRGQAIAQLQASVSTPEETPAETTETPAETTETPPTIQ